MGVMSIEKTSNDPGMCPIEGQCSVLCSSVRARNQFSGLCW